MEQLIERGGRKYRKLTDNELLEKMNKSLSGKLYSNEEAWKIIKQARKWGCNNLQEYFEKQKSFSEQQENDNISET